MKYKKLKKKLKQLGVWKQFKANINNLQCNGIKTFEDKRKEFKANALISAAFIWSDTPEGHKFWSKINNKINNL